MRHLASTMQRVLAATLAAALLAGCGAGGATGTAGVGQTTLAAVVPDTFAAVGGTPFTVQGTGFESLVGTSARVILRTLDGSLAFGGSSSTEVEGFVASATTITATAPGAPLCATASLGVSLEVVLESGLSSGVASSLGVTFARPNVTDVAPTSIASYDPGSFTLQGGTFLPPAGASCTVRFTGGSAGSWSGASQADVVGTVTASGTIVGTAPANTDTADFTASVQALFSDGSCSNTVTVSYVAPRVTGMTPSSAYTTTPVAFTLTGGSNLPPVGTALQVRFSGGPAGSWSGSNQVDVAASVATSTTITGTTPVNSSISDFTASVTPIFAGGAGVDTLTIAYVAPVISIDTQPTDQEACDGAATFTVAASVVPVAALTYQWQKREAGATTWADVVTGGTGTTLSLTGLLHAADHDDSYRVVVTSSGAASVTSAAGTLTVPLVTIDTQPADQVASGGVADFTVAASVAPTATLTYQWQKREAGGTTFADVTTGGTSATLSLTGLTFADDDGDSYQVIVSSTCAASVTSDIVTLTVPYWEQVGADIDGAVASGLAGRSVSLSSDGLVVAVGVPEHDFNGTGAGGVDVYDWDALASSWVARASLYGAVAGDGFGASVSLSADGLVLAVGAPGSNGSTGEVQVFAWDSGTASWLQVGTTLLGDSSGDEFGRQVSLADDGLTLAVGAPGSDLTGIDAGLARAFFYDGIVSDWFNIGQDLQGDAAGDAFGSSVSIEGDGLSLSPLVLAVGAPGDDVNGVDAGLVRTLDFDTTTLLWVARADLYGDLDGDAAGVSVSLSSDGSALAFGMPGSDASATDAGRVVILDWDSGALVWTARGLALDGEAASDASGSSVSLSGDGLVVAVGAPFTAGGGHVRAFGWDAVGSVWVQLGVDLDAEAAGDEFGSSVSLDADGNTLAVGGPLNSGAGHVRVFAGG